MDREFFRRPTDPEDHPGLADALRDLQDQELASPPRAPERPESPTPAEILRREAAHRAAREDRPNGAHLRP